jgi:hypothetical protein
MFAPQGHCSTSQHHCLPQTSTPPHEYVLIHMGLNECSIPTRPALLLARYRPPLSIRVGAVLKSKDDTYSELECIMLEIRHMHVRYHSSSGAFAHALRFDSDFVFEASMTRQICTRLGVGVVLATLRSPHVRQGGTPLAHTPGQRISDVTHNVRTKFRVVVRCQHCCVPSQPYLQPRYWPLRWRSTHHAHVESTKASSLPMDPCFLSSLAHIDSPPLTAVAKDIYPSLLGSL